MSTDDGKPSGGTQTSRRKGPATETRSRLDRNVERPVRTRGRAASYVLPEFVSPRGGFACDSVGAWAGILGTKRVARVEENTAADQVTLSTQQLERLSSLSEAVGDGYSPGDMSSVDR